MTSATLATGGSAERARKSGQAPFAGTALRVLRTKGASPVSAGDGRPSFEFFQSRIGLLQTETLWLGSPFDYRSQAQI